MARKEFGGRLDQFGGGEVGDHHRSALGDDRRVAGGEPVPGPLGRHTEHQPVRVQGVLHRVPFAQELRVPRQLRQRARGRAGLDEAVSRSAVPIGTVDLPAIRQCRSSCGASRSRAAST